MKKCLSYSSLFYKANSYGITCKAANKYFPIREKYSFTDSGGGGSGGGGGGGGGRDGTVGSLEEGG